MEWVDFAIKCAAVEINDCFSICILNFLCAAGDEVQGPGIYVYTLACDVAAESGGRREGCGMSVEVLDVGLCGGGAGEDAFCAADVRDI